MLDPHCATPGPQRMTGALWQEIVAVNVGVNAPIKPMNDLDIYGKDEVWAYPDGAGDCEDYVLEKRRDLMRRGLSLSNLLITVVRKPDGEGHAVLTVRTDKGDFVLDNLTDSVRQWDATGYRFLKRQATNHTGRWVTIREGHGAAGRLGQVTSAKSIARPTDRPALTVMRRRFRRRLRRRMRLRRLRHAARR